MTQKPNVKTRELWCINYVWEKRREGKSKTKTDPPNWVHLG